MQRSTAGVRDPGDLAICCQVRHLAASRHAACLTQRCRNGCPLRRIVELWHAFIVARKAAMSKQADVADVASCYRSIASLTARGLATRQMYKYRAVLLSQSLPPITHTTHILTSPTTRNPTTMASQNPPTATTTIPPFTLASRPGTDIWRKPPSHNAFSAPTHPATLPTYALPRFQRARLTFALPPASQLRQYDQAGLLLHLTKPGLPDEQTKWLKTGIEWYYGKPYISTVGCDTWADWSVVPIPDFVAGGEPSATIEARREKDVLGKSLWVYWIVKGADGKEERVPLREVNWFFSEEMESEGWNVGVGGYVARPTEEGGEGELSARFGEGVEVEVLQG